MSKLWKLVFIDILVLLILVASAPSSSSSASTATVQASDIIFRISWAGETQVGADLGALANVTLPAMNVPIYIDTPAVAYWRIDNLPLTSETRIFNDTYWNGTDLGYGYTHRTHWQFHYIYYRPTAYYGQPTTEWTEKGMFDNSSLAVMSLDPENAPYYAIAFYAPACSDFQELIVGTSEEFKGICLETGEEEEAWFAFSLPYFLNISSIRIEIAVKNVSATRIHITAFASPEIDSHVYGPINAGGWITYPESFNNPYFNKTNKQFGVVDLYYQNETGAWLMADPTSKYFNYTFLDNGWYLFSVDVWNYLEGILWITNTTLKDGAINIGRVNIGFSIVANGTVLVDRFVVTVSGFAISPYRLFTVATTIRPSSSEWTFTAIQNTTAIDVHGRIELEGILRKITPKLDEITVWSYDAYYRKFIRYTIKILSTSEEIQNAIWDLFNNTPAKFIHLVKTQILVKATGDVKRVLKRASTCLTATLDIKSDVPLRVEQISVPRNVTSVVILEDAKEAVRKVYDGQVLYISSTTTDLHITVKAYPLVPVHVKIVDARGHQVEGKIILTNIETGEQYIVTSGENVWIESGTYEAKATVLLYEQEFTDITVTLQGGIVTLRLNKDIREIAGDAVRMLLLYIPVAILIPVVLMGASVPLLVRKKRA